MILDWFPAESSAYELWVYSQSVGGGGGDRDFSVFNCFRPGTGLGHGLGGNSRPDCFG